MPLFEYVCKFSHVTEKLVRNGDVPMNLTCSTCSGPAFRKEFGLVAFSMRGRTNTTESLSSYYEAATEMEHTYKSTDDPAVKAANPPEIWHAAKMRSQAQMLAGAQTWDKDKPTWKPEEVA